MIDWLYGIFTALIVFPLYVSWSSSGKLSVFLRGMFEPFAIGFLGGIMLLVMRLVANGWTKLDSIIGFAIGIAVVVLVSKGVRGTLKEELMTLMKEEGQRTAGLAEKKHRRIKK